RPADDGALLSELLSRVGRDALEPLGGHLAGAPPRLLRHLLAVFDQLDAWPSQADPSYYATHPDVVVRREALKFLLKRDATRASATLTAVRDREVSILGLGIGHVDSTCPVDVATVLMSRYAEPELTPDVRVELIRVVASSGTGEAQAWLGALLLSRRWILGPRLRPPTPECIAAAAALVGHFRASPLAQQVVALAQRGPAVEYRRAVYRTARGAA
ncbi:MAG: hypothetical protein H7066_19980, partial [Cytophagaceae bacterium]|nr:hypothetical protein [Gemmatimonadaceae bacterium]